MRFKVSQPRLLLFLFIIWAGVSFFYLLFSHYTWPPYGGDNVYYFPPAIQYAKDHVLTNKILPAYLDFDSTGQSRLVYHGFLYQMIIGSLAWLPTYASAVKVVAIFKVVVLAFFVFLLYKILSLARFGTFWKLSFTVTASLGVSTFIHGVLGRPEPPAILLLALLMIFITHINRRWHWVLFGSTMGVLFCSYPVGGILLCIVYISYYAIKFSFRQTVIHLFFTLSLASVVSVFLFIWYPYTAWDWFKGLYGHLIRIEFLQFNPTVFTNLFFAPFYSAYGFIFMLAALAAIYLYSRFKKEIKTKWLFLCGTFLFLISEYNLAIKGNFSLLMFSPLAYLVILYGLIAWEDSLRGEKKKSFALALRILIAIGFFVSSFGFLRDVVLLFDYRKNGLSYEKARYMLSEFRDKNKGKLLISPGLFTLTEDYSNMIVMLPDKEVLDKFQPEHIFLQQVYRSKRIPPEIPGYKLINNYYSERVPVFLGMKIARVTKAYNFAIYKKVSRQ